MNREDLKKRIIQQILELEKKNIYNGYPLNRDEVITRIENIIIDEVDAYENRAN